MGEAHGGPAGAAKRVVLVGHCGFDSGSLAAAAKRALAGCEVVSCHDQASFSREVERADLLLVNRVLDGRFSDSNGIALIRSAAGGGGRKAVMVLISDYAWAQEEAEAAGAAPGFGKSMVGSSEAAERLRAAAGAGAGRLEAEGA